MDKIRQKSWFSITAYMVISIGVLAILLFFAETYFPNQSADLIPRRPDPITRWIFKAAPWQTSWRPDGVKNIAQPEKLFFRINEKMVAGKTELIYRGLVGQAEFQIDVIILELDPQVSYPYRFKISEAKKLFRLANRNYKLISAQKAALQLKQIK
jgi:hypothetical protein